MTHILVITVPANTKLPKLEIGTLTALSPGARLRAPVGSRGQRPRKLLDFRLSRDPRGDLLDHISIKNEANFSYQNT